VANPVLLPKSKTSEGTYLSGLGPKSAVAVTAAAAKSTACPVLLARLSRLLTRHVDIKGPNGPPKKHSGHGPPPDVKQGCGGEGISPHALPAPAQGLSARRNGQRTQSGAGPAGVPQHKPVPQPRPILTGRGRRKCKAGLCLRKLGASAPSCDRTSRQRTGAARICKHKVLDKLLNACTPGVAPCQARPPSV
jgi:hypothetical protein